MLCFFFYGDGQAQIRFCFRCEHGCCCINIRRNSSQLMNNTKEEKEMARLFTRSILLFIIIFLFIYIAHSKIVANEKSAGIEDNNCDSMSTEIVLKNPDELNVKYYTDGPNKYGNRKYLFVPKEIKINSSKEAFIEVGYSNFSIKSVCENTTAKKCNGNINYRAISLKQKEVHLFLNDLFGVYSSVVVTFTKPPCNNKLK